MRATIRFEWILALLLDTVLTSIRSSGAAPFTTWLGTRLISVSPSYPWESNDVMTTGSGSGPMTFKDLHTVLLPRNAASYHK